MPGHCLEPHSDPVRCLLRMASWWTVVLILQFGALWEYTHATSCTAITKNTCAPTLQVTGTCTNSVCDCKSGFVTTRTGCSGSITPKLDIVALSGSTEYPGNGEVLEGGPITLRCNPDYGNGQYVWKRDTTILSNKDRNLALTTAATGDTGSYTCKIKFSTNDFETVESSPVTVTVVASPAGSFAIAPTVLGMPARALSGASITLECGNLPSGQQLAFQWFKTSVDQSTATQKFTFTQATGTDTYTCKITKDAGTPGTFSSDTSPAVTQPTIPTTITGVYLSSVSNADLSIPRPDVPPVISAEVGSRVSLHCAVNDTDLHITGSTSLTYKWKKNSGDIGSETSRSFTISSLVAGDTGSYQCEATLGTTPYLSNPVKLNVENKIIDSVDLVVIPTTPVLGGYAVLDCQVKIANLSRVSYSWTKNSIPMHNITDRALQINNLVASDNTGYACTATVGLDSASSTTVTLSAAALGSATPAVTSVSTTFGVGNKYTLTCGDDYTIPGLTYRWYEADVVVEGQTSKTYEITVKTGTTAYTCDIALGSTTSLKSNPGLSVIAKQLLAVYINVGTVKVTGTYTPVTGTSVTLTCVATTAAGASGTVTYSWTKGSTATGSGTSTLTFDAGTNTNGDYVCRATIGIEYSESSLTVTSSATVAKPVIVEARDTYNDGASFSYSEGGNYVLTCVTTSHSPSLIYAWTKGGNTVGNSRVYQITSAKKGATGDDGSYICSAKSGDQTAVASDAVTITIGDKGKPCLYVNDCDGDQYADVCENSRCVCATGYTVQGNTCSGQGIVTISMLLLVLCGVIKLIM